MRIYNTMTRQKEELVTLVPNEVKIYACGPTVYGLMHIGNGRQICVFDVLRRYLEYRGYKVTYAQNFTDIDDKIIKKANEEGVGYKDISERYITEYKRDAHGLNVRDADLHPKATENIDEIISIVSELIDKGYAYATESGDVYFSTAKDESYGKLSHQPLEDLMAGARISAGEEKREPVDFAVWKAAKEGEPYWNSPWGKGRPGWHIECSAMVKAYLGETIDIHGGGQDLIFPHHENEVAQSECSSGKTLANYWVHNGMITVDNKKMGKSLGNFFTVRDVAEEYGYEPIRYLLISSHYRSPMNYSLQSVEQSMAALERLYNFKENLEFLLSKVELEESEGDTEVLAGLSKYEEQFITAMDDDLNSADGIAAIFELVREVNTLTAAGTTPSRKLLSGAYELFMRLSSVLGLLYEKGENGSASSEDSADAAIEELIAQRTQARADKNWALADEIRDKLTEMGIVLEDTPNGIKWSKK